MKTIFYTLLILTGFYGLLFADEIYMNDLRVIKGKIIQVTDNNVEFSQEGKPLLIVPRDQVFKIKYDNGQVVQIADAKGQDKIFLKDGSVIKGTISKVTSDVIMYSATDKQEAVVRDNVIKIVYADGKVIQISEASAEEAVVEKEPESIPVKEEFKTRSGGFIDSYIWMGMFVGGSSVFGNIENKENRFYEEKRTGYSFFDQNIYTSGSHSGFELNLLLPSIKFNQVRGFDLTGIKFGIKSTYVFSEITQELSEDYYEDDGDSVSRVLGEGTLLKYRSVNAGPEINIIYSPRTDLFNMVVQFYTLGGYIHNGKLTAAPALRDAGTPVTESYTADFTGYSFTAGVGHYFVFNRMVPITLGYGFFYSYSKIDFDRNVAIYGGAKKASFDEFGFTLSVGAHLWGAE
jgi:hypothetical protein